MMLQLVACCVLITISGIYLTHAEVKTCPDRSALKHVSALVANNDQNVQEMYDVNLNSLIDRWSIVQVTKANVSVLCTDAITPSPKIAFISLIDVNLDDILPGAFTKSGTALATLSFAVNKLSHIKKEQLQNLESVKSLSFASNRITTIDSDAFDALVRLEKIYLDRNYLLAIDTEWFKNNPALKFIDLSFNIITRVQNSAFTLQPTSVLEIVLSSNQIGEVESEAVVLKMPADEMPHLSLRLNRNELRSGPSLELFRHLNEFRGSLWLENNLFQCIEHDVLEYLKISTISLYIEHNPLDCDCMNKLNRFTADNKLGASFHYNTTLFCDLDVIHPRRYGK